MYPPDKSGNPKVGYMQLCEIRSKCFHPLLRSKYSSWVLLTMLAFSLETCWDPLRVFASHLLPHPEIFFRSNGQVAFLNPWKSTMKLQSPRELCPKVISCTLFPRCPSLLTLILGFLCWLYSPIPFLWHCYLLVRRLLGVTFDIWVSLWHPAVCCSLRVPWSYVLLCVVLALCPTLGTFLRVDILVAAPCPKDFISGYSPKFLLRICSTPLSSQLFPLSFLSSFSLDLDSS